MSKQTNTDRAARSPWRLWAIALGSSVLICGLAITHPIWLPAIAQILAPETLAAAADTFRQLGPWAPVVSLALMVIQSVIAPLPGSLIAAANGIVFGVWWGSLLSCIGGLAGAIVTYLLGRWFSAGIEARWGRSPYWGQMNRLGDRHGFWVVLVARLTPIISLDFIGYLAGAARMPFSRYLLANSIGLAPGMIVYTVLGHNLAYSRAATWQLGAIALVLIGRSFFARRLFA
jgi:uncharacterized membrane protein YdjX (TVP38/TMEM64 family)